MKEITLNDRFCGCLLGGALGDALGYPVADMTTDEIEKQYGRNGITAIKTDKQTGEALISDKTQMTLFTAEGIIWADKLGGKNEISSYTSYVFYSYQRWLYTQEKLIASREYSHILDKDDTFASRLLREEALFSKRYSESECIETLKNAKEHNYGKFTNKVNNSKGCDGVVRVAPAGLYFYRDSERAFRMSAEFAAITHTNPTGYLAGGALGSIIAELINGSDLNEAVDVAMYILKGYDGCMETYRSLDHARSLDAGDVPPMEAVSRLGQGHSAEEALAIAVYCSLCHSVKTENALRLAVNHNGVSNVTGSICGNIMGAYKGASTLPSKWLRKLEIGELIEETADALCECVSAAGQ